MPDPEPPVPVPSDRPETTDTGQDAARIDIVAYRPDWPAAFDREREVLGIVFAGTGARIEHVGSTAVPGLGGKPIIDIMVGVGDLADAEARIEELEEAGYHYVPDYEDRLPDRRYFRKPGARPRTHHLHVVLRDRPFWQDHILLRDWLRDHPEVARRYFELKLRLAAEHGASRWAYAEAKTPFIAQVLSEARESSGKRSIVPDHSAG